MHIKIWQSWYPELSLIHNKANHKNAYLQVTYPNMPP